MDSNGVPDSYSAVGEKKMGFFRGQYQLQQPLLFIIQCTETIKSVQDWNF